MSKELERAQAILDRMEGLCEDLGHNVIDDLPPGDVRDSALKI